MWFTIPKNLLHIPTFAYYHQDIIVHIQVAHQFLMLAESDKNKYEMPETNVENLAYESKMINIVIGKVHQIYTDVTSDDIARYVRQILAEDEYHRMKPTEVAKEVVAIITGSPTRKKRRPSSKAPASKNICDYISNT